MRRYQCQDYSATRDACYSRVKGQGRGTVGSAAVVPPPLLYTMLGGWAQGLPRYKCCNGELVGADVALDSSDLEKQVIGNGPILVVGGVVARLPRRHQDVTPLELRIASAVLVS